MRVFASILLSIVLWSTSAYADTVIALFDGFQGNGSLTGLENDLHHTLGGTVTTEEFSLFQSSVLPVVDQSLALNFFTQHSHAGDTLIAIGHSRGGEEAAIVAGLVEANLLIQLDPIYFSCIASLTGFCPQAVPHGVGEAFNYFQTNPLSIFSGDAPVVGATNVNVYTQLGFNDCHSGDAASCLPIYSDSRIWNLVEGDIREVMPRTTPVPEPSSIILLVAGIIALKTINKGKLK